MLYRNDRLEKINFPLGGIGTGSIGLAGNGSFKDWEIFNNPNKGSVNGYSHIAVKAVTGGKAYARVLNGDTTSDLIGTYSMSRFVGFGYGPDKQTMCGFSHFKNTVFNGKFPLAELTFKDESFPIAVKLGAFNPFIPLDADASSIPAAFFEIEAKNTLTEELDFTVAFSVGNPFDEGINAALENGALFCSAAKKDALEYGELALLTDSENAEVQPYWSRGNWTQDNVVKYWAELESNKKVKPRNYDAPGKNDHATVYGHISLKPGEKKSVRFVLAWFIPNRCNDWSKPEKSEPWQNYYAKLFSSALDAAEYSLKNFDSLYKRTSDFARALHSSTLDKTVIDAASSCLSVLKSPTTLRLPDGTFYGWEGNHEKSGSCEGTCQHVYNYAYALCFLFPTLERSIRNAEFKYNTDKDGFMCFRTPLPLGSPFGRWHACVDGQMGEVFKWYREWKLSGNNEWLKANWDNIKLILDFAASKDNVDGWDADGDGILEGRQHHTLDLELFGPSSWLEGMYILAIKCAAEMAEFLSDRPAHDKYMRLYENGSKFIKEQLFNGKYFIQRVDIKDRAVVEKFGEAAVEQYWDTETNEIKYQVADGCLLDQLLARWHADILKVDGIFDDKQVKTALKEMFKNNFKPSLRETVNTWRVFALNDEGGSIICDYPKGVYKPKMPISYTEECMTGFEYAFGGLLISEGFVDEGLTVIKAIRDRYDGKKRNPFNEIECGSNYARSMAAFSLIPVFSGFTFDLPRFKIGFNPVEINGKFKSFASLGTAWGTVTITKNDFALRLKDGSVTLRQIELPFIKNVNTLLLDGKMVDFKFENGNVLFEKTAIYNSIVIK